MYFNILDFYSLLLFLKLAVTESLSEEYEDSIFISGGIIVNEYYRESSQGELHHFARNKAVYKLKENSSKWEKFAELKLVKCHHGSTVIGNQLYLAGGFNESYVDLADTEVIPINIKPAILNHTIPIMHNKRSQFGMCSFAGCIFVAGGNQNGDEALDKCEIYSLESCEWTEVSSMNTKKCAFPLIYFDDKIWAIGGRSNGTSLDTIETYELSENKWTTIDTKLLSKRSGHSAVVNNNKFFVIGGLDRDGTLSSVEVYSSETKQFSIVKSMNISRVDFACCVVNSMLYVIGGLVDLENEIGTDDVEIYDIVNDVWTKGPSLPFTLTGFGCSNIL